MIVQVLAEDENSSKNMLDEKGGYISERKVKLIKTTNLNDTIKSVK